MNHSFDIDHAGLYGIHEAILINNLQFWISRNIANGAHQHEGRTWTYNSAKAFAVLFPYFSDRQVRRTIDSLESQLVVIKGDYNTRPADRTLWLAFLDESEFLTIQKPAPNPANGAQKRKKPAPKTANGAPIPANGIAESGESLIRADVNTDVNTDEGGADAQEGFAAPPLTGAICMLMKAMGMQSVNPSHPDLRVLIDKGADAGLFAEVTRRCVKDGKSFNYALAVIKGQMTDAARLAESAMSAPVIAVNRAAQAESFTERDARNKREKWERETGRQWPANELPSGARPTQPLTIVIDENSTRRIS